MFKKQLGPKPPGIALLYGKSVDNAINVDMEQKIVTRENLPSDDVKDAFVTEYDNNKDDTFFHKDDKPDVLREVGINSVGKWADEIAEKIQPISVQEKLAIEFDDFNYDILQFADVITEDKIIIDNKTAGRSVPQKDGEYKISNDHMLQLTMYGIGYKENHNEEVNELGLDYLIKNKNPKIQQVRWKPNDEDKKYALSLIQNVAKGIDNETYIPNRSSFMCSKKFCAFWKECEENFGGKVRE
jgi:CRISPR/Cas system-associated exonuclease Cas4 (RecB family)